MYCKIEPITKNKRKPIFFEDNARELCKVDLPLPRNWNVLFLYL